jgi:ABC-type spermidine/putrescine transport system permease subunit I
LGRNRNYLENTMIAIFFFALGIVFIWLLFKGYTTQEIMARGWGIQVRIYRRSSEPIRYWATFWMYLVIVVICIVVGILLTLKTVATHAA